MSRRRFDDLDEDSVDEHETLTRSGRRSQSYYERVGMGFNAFKRTFTIARVCTVISVAVFLWSFIGIYTYVRQGSNAQVYVSQKDVGNSITGESGIKGKPALQNTHGTVILAEKFSASSSSDQSNQPTRVRKGSSFSLVEKHSRERAGDVLHEEKKKFCAWWESQKKSLSMIAKQITGDLVTFLINLNFEFSEDQHEYIKQLEEWRLYVLSDEGPKQKFNADGSPEVDLFEPIEPKVKRKCRSVCLFDFRTVPHASKGEERVYVELIKTNTYRQTLVKCMLCVQGSVHLHDKCQVRDESKHIARRLAPNRIREAFERIYDHTEQHTPQVEPTSNAEDLKRIHEIKKEYEPFFLGAGVGAAFAPYLSLLDTFTYSPEGLVNVFPLPDRESQVDVTAFREQSTWLAQQSKSLRTETDAGIGGGMGIQLICKPHKKAPPLLLLSSGGGGGRGFQMNVDPLNAPGEALPLGGSGANRGSHIPHSKTTKDEEKDKNEKHFGKNFVKFNPECCNSRVHTCCGGSIHFEEADDKEEGLQLRARGRLAQDQSNIKREIHAGLGGGGGIQVSFGPDPITHQVRRDHDLNFGGGGGGGASLNNGDYSESHGSQKDASISLPTSFPEFRKRLFRDLLHCVAHAEAASAQPELWIVGGGGVGLGTRMDLKMPASLTPQMFSQDDDQKISPHTPYAKVSISADAGMGFKLKVPQAWITSFPIPHLAPLRTQVHKFVENLDEKDNEQQQPEKQEEPLFDSATSLAKASAQCVEHCLDLQGSSLTQQHADVLAPHLDAKLTSTGTQSSHTLFYAHCVCPCLQKSFGQRHWAGYMACTPLAIGTYDVATSGHVAVSDVIRAPHSEKAKSSLLRNDDHSYEDELEK